MAGRPDDFTRQFMNQMGLNSSQDRLDDTMILDYLKSINAHLGEIAENSSGWEGFRKGSQGSARDAADSNRDARYSGPFSAHHANSYQTSRVQKSFLDGFEKSLLGALGGNTFKKKIEESLTKFAEALGTDLQHLEEDFGKEMGKVVGNTLRQDQGIFGKIFGKAAGKAESLFGKTDQISELLKKMKSDPKYDYNALMRDMKGMDFGKIGSIFKDSNIKFSEGISKMGGESIAAAVAIKRMQLGAEGASDVLKGLSDLWDGVSKAANRYEESRKKNQEFATERFKADIETIIKYPFDLLTKAAEEVYSAWSANIRLIGQTQGYNKADLQDLMAAYAARLQAEGLSNVVPATDVYNNLAKVLQSGLSGRAAVEFAYQATKYGAAIPTQDFFSFVDTYASIAANAIATGKDESEALQLANASLRDFAGSLLYVSRNLTGGYSTGLKDAGSLYGSAARIAQAAKSGNIGSIANALLAIQGYVGSVAPDLATSLSSKIYQLATGGNASDIVALRSLAGVNASNTEFLRMFAQDPRSILGSMFANLGAMFSQSPDAYMEKAEGYASLFGLSPEAFQRIDFMSLAAAIGNMADNTQNTLDENLKLLREGQTTTSTDQLKIAQINKYMVEEGLAYVIDNEAAQMIQQHMWDEQLARQLMEANYAVELKGTAGQALEKILEGLGKILQFLSPIFWVLNTVSKVASVAVTAVQAETEQAEIRKVLQASLVGSGNAADLNHLLRRNYDLSLTRSLVELMGGTSAYHGSSAIKIIGGIGSPLSGLYDLVRGAFADVGGARSSASTITPSSRYSGWGSLGNISKSRARLASALLGMTSGSVSTQVVRNVAQVASASAATARSQLDRMLADEYLVDQFIKQGADYESWAQSASRFGITNFEAAVKAAGYNESDLREFYASKQSEAGLAEKAAQADREKMFQEAGTNFWSTRFWEEYNTPLTSKIDSVVTSFDYLISLESSWRDDQLNKINQLISGQIDWKEYFNTTWVEESWKNNFVGESGLFTKFFDSFVKTFVDATYFTDSNYKYSDVTEVQRREDAQKGDAVYALADALTGSLVDLQNPTAQTNALLAQILVVATAIMNQNNTVAGTMSLSDALAGLAVGLTTTTPLSENPMQNA